MDEAEARGICGARFNKDVFDNLAVDGRITQEQFRGAAKADDQIVELRKLTGVSMFDALREADDSFLSIQDGEEREKARRALIRASSEVALALFDDMTEEERSKTQNQGRMEFYSEAAQKQRTRNRSDPGVDRQLHRWWRATKIFDDTNDDLFLDQKEYAGFHKRLLRLLQNNDDPDDDMTDEEAREAMADDFTCDAGEDSRVAREEFLSSVFQLADQWCETTTTEEYVDFLREGYTIVYGPELNADKLVFPPEWKVFLKGNATTKFMSTEDCIETTTEIYRLKIKADNVDDKKGSKRDNLAEFVVEYFENKLGRGMALKKKMKSLMNCLRNHCNPTDDRGNNHTHPWIQLFCKLCGCSTPSGRIRPLPPLCTYFACDFLEKATTEVVEKNERPSGMDSVLEKGFDCGLNNIAQGYLPRQKARTMLINQLVAAAAAKAEAGELLPAVREMINGLLSAIAVPINIESGKKVGASALEADEDPTDNIEALVCISNLLVLACDSWVVVTNSTCPPLPPAAKVKV